MRKLIVFYLLALYSFPALSVVQSTGKQCDFHEDDFLSAAVNTNDDVVDIKADEAELVGEGTSIFTGDVVISRNGQELKSERATYNRLSGRVTAKGHVQMRDRDLSVEATRAEWFTSHDVGHMEEAKYKLRANHARGSAAHVYRQGVKGTNLKNASYTTCKEGNDSWLLQSSNVVLDHEKEVGSAQNVVVRVKGFPIFYSPYLSFPLSDTRKSGFLTPTVGSSDETGFSVTAPYYWNIAPNKDATLTPHYMFERGLMLKGEFRYLSKAYKGKFDAGFLASDKLEKEGTTVNPFYKKDRKHFSAKHEGKLSTRWSTDLDYNYVSDKAYLEDFSPNLSLVSTTHINRQLNVRYAGDNWNFTGRLQGYQTLTSASKPYQRLPQLRISGAFPDKWMGLTYGIDSEYVAFDHDSRISGQRFNIEPSIRFPWTSAAAFVTPRIAVRHTQYDLDQSVNVGGDVKPTRTVPITSIDSGLFFERDLSFLSSKYIQTLEPRAYYLYIPERDQLDIPVFDSGLRSFSMGQMFAYDRFSGVDRVGDANQLALALTSRIINQQTGQENVRLSLGQIRYFKDRVVTLSNGASPDTQSDSDMVAEMAAAVGDNWTMQSTIQWDPHGDTSHVKSLANLFSSQIRYKSDKGQLFNLSHRYRKNTLEQIDMSGRLPLGNEWSLVGRWYHSLRDDRTLEAIAGIEYESCCLASRLVLRNFINGINDKERNLAIFFQFELKGLGNFGQQTEALLARSILGYGL